MSKADTIIINGIKYIIRNKEDIIENCLYKGIQWNNDIVLLIGLCIKKYRLKHFVNIGCHIGTIALPISKYIKKVSAIEAYPPTFKYLQENRPQYITTTETVNKVNELLPQKEDHINRMIETKIYLEGKYDHIKSNCNFVLLHSKYENKIEGKFLYKKINNYLRIALTNIEVIKKWL